MAKQIEQLVEVEATAKFKMSDGKDVCPGDRLSVTTANALDLIATGFAKPGGATYRDRALRSGAR